MGRRKRKPDYIETTGKAEGKRGRGRRRDMILKSLASWHAEPFVSVVIVSTRDIRL